MMYLLIAILLVSTVLLYFLFFKKDKTTNDFCEFKEKDTVYNESPVQWKNSNYKKLTLSYQTNKRQDLKTIIIIEPNPVFQQIFKTLLSEHYNLYFYEDGNDFVNAFKEYRFNNTFIDLFIASEDCNHINGLTLYHINQGTDIFKNTGFILTTTNNNHYAQGNYFILIKPFDKDFFLKLVQNAIN